MEWKRHMRRRICLLEYWNSNLEDIGSGAVYQFMLYIGSVFEVYYAC